MDGFGCRCSNPGKRHDWETVYASCRFLAIVVFFIDFFNSPHFGNTARVLSLGGINSPHFGTQGYHQDSVFVFGKVMSFDTTLSPLSNAFRLFQNGSAHRV